MNINCAVDKSKYKKDRVILHSDCNGVYASVECLHHPEIRNKPVAVSGDAENRHGILHAKNEIAKNNHYNSRYRYPLGGMATIRRYSQPTGADTFTSPTRTDTLRMARLR